MAVFALEDSIELRCMRRSSVVSDSVGSKKGSEGYILATIIRVESSNSLLQFIFSQRSKCNEGIFDLELKFERVEPCVLGIVIDDNKIVFVVIYRHNG